jgi:hypothetical protein
MFVRINASSSYKCLSWEVFNCREEAWAMQKEKVLERKIGQVSEILKTMGTQMPAIKKEERKKNK